MFALCVCVVESYLLLVHMVVGGCCVGVFVCVLAFL